MRSDRQANRQTHTVHIAILGASRERESEVITTSRQRYVLDERRQRRRLRQCGERLLALTSAAMVTVALVTVGVPRRLVDGDGVGRRGRGAPGQIGAELRADVGAHLLVTRPRQLMSAGHRRVLVVEPATRAVGRASTHHRIATSDVLLVCSPGCDVILTRVCVGEADGER